MQIEFLVEERSAEAALRNLLPKMLRAGHVFNVRVFDGKTDLLSKLPSRLRGYRGWLPRDSCIVVLVDEDREDCRELKDRLENDAAQAKLLTKTAAHGRRRFQVVNRLAVEELEAWFFGNVQALARAYPRVPRTLGQKAKYRNPDAIAGGTWEALERVLKNAGYYSAGLPKIEAVGTYPHTWIPCETPRRVSEFSRKDLTR